MLGGRPSRRSGLLAPVLLTVLLLTAGLSVATGTTTHPAPLKAFPSVVSHPSSAHPTPSTVASRGSAGPDSTTYPVTFSASGLPCCWSWSVTVEGVTLGTNGGSVTFYLPNGTHLFTAAALVYYLPSPASGNVTVAGAGTGVTISYYSPPTYTVQVNESGLPAGDAWTVTAHFHDVPGGQRAFTTTSPQSYLNLRDDTYTLDITGPLGYGVINGVQTLVVAGAALYRNVSFHVGAYNLTFEEVGLPTGTAWTVELAGHFNSSTTNTVVDFLNNGSYSYLIGIVQGYTASPLIGTALIAGYDDLVPIVFTPATFPVLVTESGLPSGISWWVTVNGTRFSSSTGTLTFAEPNGTYGYTFGTEGGYTATTPYSGTFTISGSGASLSVTWAVMTYAADFTEKGLPSGTTWSVVIGNQSYQSTASNVSVSLPNGSYAFQISPVSGFSSSPTNGTFTIASAAAHESVQFNATGSASGLSTDVLPGVPAWALIGAVVALVVVVAVAVLVKKRRH